MRWLRGRTANQPGPQDEWMATATGRHVDPDARLRPQDFAPTREERDRD